VMRLEVGRTPRNVTSCRRQRSVRGRLRVTTRNVQIAISEWVRQAPAPPTMVERSRAAYGRLEAPVATLAFNPTKRTLVNLDTWFWAQDLTEQQIRGTSALGWSRWRPPRRHPERRSTTARSERCKHVYRRSSVGASARGLDGVPAYQATAVATWSVHFELDGSRVPIDGAETELTGAEDDNRGRSRRGPDDRHLGALSRRACWTATHRVAAPREASVR
jgi:hypothetical protein